MGPPRCSESISEKIVSPQSVLLCVAFSSKMQDFPLALFEPHKIPGGQFLQAVKGPLSISRPTLLYQPFLPVVLCADLLRGHCPVVQIVSEDVKQWSQWGPMLSPGLDR